MGQQGQVQGPRRSTPLPTVPTDLWMFVQSVDQFTYVGEMILGCQERTWLVGPVNVFEYEKLAEACMAPDAWAFYSSGAGDEETLRANRAAFERIWLRPRVLVDVGTIDMLTSVLGTQVSMPILIAPTAAHCLAHPEGECATAQGAGRPDRSPGAVGIGRRWRRWRLRRP